MNICGIKIALAGKFRERMGNFRAIFGLSRPYRKF